MRTSVSALLIIAFVSLALVSGCAAAEAEPAASDPASGSDIVTVSDLSGRSVQVPQPVERIAALGPGALRLVCYAGAQDRVVGIEDIETRTPVQRPYLLANPDLLDLPIIGAGGPDSAPDAERVLSAEPDVIFIAQLADSTAADELQAATGIPVVVLSYGALGTFGEEFEKSLGIVGESTGTSERTDEVLAFIDKTLDDLSARTSDVADDERPTAYIGALGFKGLHGIESSQVDYPPFGAVGVESVTAQLDQPGSVMIDKEQLIEWDPELVFIDRSGLQLVFDDVAENQALYEGLTAVREGRVFTQIPFNNYWTNVETALADAYFVGSVAFPERFDDVDAAHVYDKVSEALLGVPLYDDVTAAYGGGFETVDLLDTE